MEISILCDNKNKGQSLIEIVVAVGIIAIVLVGVSDLITRSLKMASFQNDAKKATVIAQTQLDYYRQQRDLNSVDFFVNPTANYSVCVGDYDKTKFDCKITYTDITNGVDMKVDLTWKDGDNSVTTSLSQTLAKLTVR